MQDKELCDIPILLIGNKCDLESQRAVTTNEAIELANQLGCEYLEASAKTRINVDETFYEIVREIRRNQEQKKLLVAIDNESKTIVAKKKRKQSIFKKFVKLFRKTKKRNSIEQIELA